MRTMSSKYAEIPHGLVGRESQRLSMQERCVLHCEDDTRSWDGAGCVLVLWQAITIQRPRLGRCVTPFIIHHSPCCELDTHGLMLGFGRSARNVRGAH